MTAAKPWRMVRCPDCNGWGVHDSLEGAVTCTTCDARGQLVVWESGRLALWPGGPLRGQDDSAWKRGRKVTHP